MLIQMFFDVTLQILHSYLLLLRMCLIHAHNTQRLHNCFQLVLRGKYWTGLNRILKTALNLSRPMTLSL